MTPQQTMEVFRRVSEPLKAFPPDDPRNKLRAIIREKIVGQIEEGEPPLPISQIDEVLRTARLAYVVHRDISNVENLLVIAVLMGMACDLSDEEIKSIRLD